MLAELVEGEEDSWQGGAYHAVAGELRIGLQNAVCSRVVASGIHGIRTSLVERSWESHIACIPTSDCDFWHAVIVL